MRVYARSTEKERKKSPLLSQHLNNHMEGFKRAHLLTKSTFHLLAEEGSDTEAVTISQSVRREVVQVLNLRICFFDDRALSSSKQSNVQTFGGGQIFPNNSSTLFA